MHSTLTELLENMKSGLLWVHRDATVRYANSDAGLRTGLAPGHRLFDPDLAAAVAAAVTQQTARKLVSVGVAPAPGLPPPDLQCRVIPGLSREDAFVLIAPEAADDAGSAFDNLMQVIRADLRDPLAETRGAMALAREHGGGPELDALVDGVQELVRVLDKLVDLAQLWGSGALFANDRIELWALLQSVWAEVEPVALARQIKVRFRAQSDAASLATLYGSEHWLRRVFLECLESALRSSPSGAVLDIEHRQMGPRAVIVFRDCGMFAPRVADAVDLPRNPPSGRRAPAKRDARDQIGFKLCQHIVSLHGGQLREEDDDGMRNFVIDLPTGAPHRSGQPQLDIMQAQQYARDLAELMSRARKRDAAAR
ncbi:sensor histidine kinase [Rubrivivax sp. JA1024]|nr:sensor histidine kinase [Rubrivivax sp. JA1024]